ncbi:hypothetical protein CMV_009072 [Castanea mollissima]|uniref:Uncharacterized protein n=1 Tax=Castanea mollissima TaxID=60419 RepID=A0A8J4RPU9_9ROSI|nr:hypothetical protein CMV_009072 [Castanea mollissima]
MDLQFYLYVFFFFERADYQVLTSSDSATKLIDIAALLGKSMGLALVDCSVSSETIGVMKQVVDLGCCIVMANKKPLTCTMEDYDKLISCFTVCQKFHSNLAFGNTAVSGDQIED